MAIYISVFQVGWAILLFESDADCRAALKRDVRWSDGTLAIMRLRTVRMHTARRTIQVQGLMVIVRSNYLFSECISSFPE